MTRELWDHEAVTFDDEPDHGLADPRTRSAWRDLLLEVLPPSPAVEAERIVRTARAEVLVRHLVEPVYWGKVIRDERYLLLSPR